MLALCLLLVYEVIMRYGFNSPSHWAYETSTFIFGGVGILGGAYVLLQGQHVRLDVFYGRLSPRTKAILDLVTTPVFFLVIVVLLWQSGAQAYKSVLIREFSDSVWGPPIYPIKIVVVIAVFLLLFQGIAKFIRDLYFVFRREQLS